MAQSCVHRNYSVSGRELIPRGMTSEMFCAPVTVSSPELRLLRRKSGAAYHARATANHRRRGEAMKTVSRTTATACGAAVLEMLTVPAASACGALPSIGAASAVQPLKANAEYPLEGASAEIALRDQKASVAGFTASIVGMWKITELSM